MLMKQDLFEARQNGYWTCRIPGITVTKNGVVLVTAEARPGQGGDYDFNDLLMRRSTDDGETFEPRVRLVDHTTCGDGPVSKVLEEGPAGYSDMARLPDGTVLCLYECDIVTRMCDDRYLRVARFDMEWLES